MAHFVGYHGTTRTKAEKINGESQFRKSRGNHHWLGHGAYFFLDLAWVRWWCSDVKRWPEKDQGCIKCDINVLDDHLWDLRTDDGKEQLSLAYDLAEAYSEKIGKPVQKKDLTDGAAINHLAAKASYKVIIADFTGPDTERPLSRLFRQHQTQVCVRDERCLSGYKMCII